MVLKNHIAYRFLTDSTLWMEMIETEHPDIYQEDWQKKPGGYPDKIAGLYRCLCNKDNTPYLVTNSVLQHLNLLKINKKNDHYDWTIFNKLKDQKVTFIFPDQAFLRMIVSGETLWFCHGTFDFENGSKNNGEIYWVMFYLNRNTGELCDHFNHVDVRNLEEFVYKFLCFFYLTENIEEEIPAGKTYGTRKSGKILNDFDFPVTIVNSRWNITTIRTEQFGVSGHFRVQPKGKGRSEYEVIFIDPYVKNGYKRTAKNIHQKPTL